MSRAQRKRVNVIEPPNGVKLARAIRTVVEESHDFVKKAMGTPKTKKDGTPFTPWSDEVALRLKAKEERMAANGGVDPKNEGKKMCTAHTSGVHGPKRPCDKVAMKGLDVCWTHGGGSKAAKEAARRRLVEELDPTISRLVQIRDQDGHMPSALGAATQIMNRVMGKPDSVDKDKGAGKPIINIGLAIAGIPRATVKAQIDDGNTFEAEVIDDES